MTFISPINVIKSNYQCATSTAAAICSTSVDVRIFTAKPLTSFSLTCTASSVYDSEKSNMYRCDKALGSSSGEWKSDQDGTLAWMRVAMSGQKHVTKLEIKARCSDLAASRVKEVKLVFNDGSSQMVSTLQLIREEVVIIPGTPHS